MGFIWDKICEKCYILYIVDYGYNETSGITLVIIHSKSSFDIPTAPGLNGDTNAGNRK